MSGLSRRGGVAAACDLEALVAVGELAIMCADPNLRQCAPCCAGAEVSGGGERSVRAVGEAQREAADGHVWHRAEGGEDAFAVGDRDRPGEVDAYLAAQ